MTTRVRYLPDGAAAPTSPLEVLLLAKRVLQEDPQRWTKGDVFVIGDGNYYDQSKGETPYGQKWRVCATGACLVVTVGIGKAAVEDMWHPWGTKLNDPDNVLYRAAVGLLDDVTPQEDRETIFNPVKGAPFTDVVWTVDYNDWDKTMYEDIMALYDSAIEKAQEAA